MTGVVKQDYAGVYIVIGTCYGCRKIRVMTSGVLQNRDFKTVVVKIGRHKCSSVRYMTSCKRQNST